MQRLIIIILAVLVSLPLILKDRVSGINAFPSAFSVMTSNKVLVRVSGDVRHSGIYEVIANSLASGVINMAAVNGAVKELESVRNSSFHVVNGTDLRLKINSDGTGIITIGSIPAAERIVLGIPLDINSMSEADFDRIPGVGPAMAKRIFNYRQNNGGVMKVKELLAVEGIGDKKFQKISKYF